MVRFHYYLGDAVMVGSAILHMAPNNNARLTQLEEVIVLETIYVSVQIRGWVPNKMPHPVNPVTRLRTLLTEV